MVAHRVVASHLDMDCKLCCDGHPVHLLICGSRRHRCLFGKLGEFVIQWDGAHKPSPAASRGKLDFPNCQVPRN